jgi:osmotically-inducible protein OsmY
MAGNWMDDRERMIRERDGRGLGDGRRARADEDRSWDSDDRPDLYAARRSGPDRDRVFGERESGASYGRASSTGYRSGSAAGGWQSPGYEGVSPAMRQGGYGQGVRFSGADYTGGGRFYGDDDRERIYREEFGQGGVEYGDVPPGYDAQRSATRERYHNQGYGQPGFGGYPGEYRTRKPLSGGTGGYDYAERGYGDAGRREGRSDRFEDASRGAGEFLHRAGEKVASWFTGGGEGRIYDNDYLSPNPGKRGLGPQGYKRSDERISDDVHERLTDDSYLDASNIAIAVAGGEVTLSGTVDNRDAKHRAERLVEHVSGVTHVQNNLRLATGRFPDGSGQSDSVLGEQIRAADEAVSNGTGGSGSGQSTAGRKN